MRTQANAARSGATIDSSSLRYVKMCLVLAAVALTASVLLLELQKFAQVNALPVSEIAAALALLSGLLVLSASLFPLYWPLPAQHHADEVKVTMRTGLAQTASLFESAGVTELLQRQLAGGKQLVSFRLPQSKVDYLPRVRSDVKGSWELAKEGSTIQFAFAPQAGAADYMFSLCLVPAASNGSAPKVCSGFARLLTRPALLAA